MASPPAKPAPEVEADEEYESDEYEVDDDEGEGDEYQEDDGDEDDDDEAPQANGKVSRMPKAIHLDRVRKNQTLTGPPPPHQLSIDIST